MTTVGDVFEEVTRTMQDGTTTRYQVVGAELENLTDTLLSGNTVLDRAATEELLRVLGAVASLHRTHRIDRRGRCSICKPHHRSRWLPWSRKNTDVCSVYAALSVHVGRSLVPAQGR